MPSARTSATIQGAGVQHVGRVGELEDVQLFSVPKNVWDGAAGESARIIETIKAQEEVKGVDVQSPRMRAKRGGEL